MSIPRMSYGRGLLSLTLLILLLAFSLNAYACLVPIYGGVMTAPGSNCSSSQEQSARLFCDQFKTLGTQAVPDVPAPSEDVTFAAAGPASPASTCVVQAAHLLPVLLWQDLPPRDPHVTSLVLRL